MIRALILEAGFYLGVLTAALVLLTGGDLSRLEALKLPGDNDTGHVETWTD